MSFSRRILSIATTVQILVVALIMAVTSITFTEAKMCVATEENRYLCTDDPVKANAYRMKSGESSGDKLDMSDLGVEQAISGTKDETDAVKRVIEKMKEYYLNEVIAKPEYDGVRHLCINKDRLCAFWTSVGECDSNRGFMISNCAASCRLCLQLNPNNQ